MGGMGVCSFSKLSALQWALLTRLIACEKEGIQDALGVRYGAVVGGGTSNSLKTKSRAISRLAARGLVVRRTGKRRTTHLVSTVDGREAVFVHALKRAT